MISSRSKGFTLIEVLIAITILATLGVLAAQSIQNAVKSKKKIQEQVDDLSRLRDSVKLLERDINLAYHHRDWEKELLDAAKKKSQNKTTPTNPSIPTTPTLQPVEEAPRGNPNTYFAGGSKDLNFVTMNNARLSKNRAQADHIEVGYFLRTCKGLDGKASSQCLWRRSSPWVDSDVTKGGDEIVLLENVTEFGLRYLGKTKQDWTTEWKTDPTGDAATKDIFPLAVEISITVQKSQQSSRGATEEKGKKYSMQLVVPIHFPNNKEETTNSADGTTAPLDPSNSQGGTQ